MAENSSDQASIEGQEPTSVGDDQTNPFKPMSAANANPSAKLDVTRAPMLMITAAMVTAGISAATRIIVYGYPWTTSVFDVTVGLVLAVAFSNLPMPTDHDWRRKYWQVLRWLLYFVALIAIVFTPLTVYGWLLAYALFIAVPFIGAYFIERTIKRRKETL